MKYTNSIIKHECEIKQFLYRLEKLYRSGEIKLADVYAILLRKCHRGYSWKLIPSLWPTYFPEIAWQGELGSVGGCTVLYCPDCDSFKGIDQFEYRPNAKLMRSRLCVGCLNKWRKDKAAGKLPYHSRKPIAKKEYIRKGYEGRQPGIKPEGPPK